MTTIEKKNTVMDPCVNVTTSVDAPAAANPHPDAPVDDIKADKPALSDAYVGSEMLVEDVPSLGIAKGIKGRKYKKGGKAKAKKAAVGFKEADNNDMDEQEGWWKAAYQHPPLVLPPPQPPPPVTTKPPPLPPTTPQKPTNPPRNNKTTMITGTLGLQLPMTLLGLCLLVPFMALCFGIFLIIQRRYRSTRFARKKKWRYLR
ncbi:hypothetical protein EDC01DRAFT_791205 [Geopyxis carbonaria]|nr:hypothetical protein EDC01DRAFT_791205 [Geopyxis carbonaria]